MTMALVQVVDRAELVLDAVPKHRRCACCIGSAARALRHIGRRRVAAHVVGGQRAAAPARAGVGQSARIARVRVPAAHLARGAAAQHRGVPLHAVHVDKCAFDNAQLDLLVNVQVKVLALVLPNEHALNDIATSFILTINKDH
ncbi:hypothetical protein AYI70_g2217 [Smittium culicis]|uniref:Uncharacterized protein n=1 Tax=Smittium culicis TaxID=133412 RepID=A0A1R1Y9K3_9FUNG|nr:hypothetical protein AYI70_g2217 [Smittium culicis]